LAAGRDWVRLGPTIANAMERNDMDVAASGFLLPEGPVALADGSVLVVEVGGGRLSRVAANGSVEVVAHLGGGPNGAAIGPDGAVYVCNNGGGYDCAMVDGRLRIALAPERYVGGSIQRIDLATGVATTLYTDCDGVRLLAPNDIVFDADGGFGLPTTACRKRIARPMAASITPMWMATISAVCGHACSRPTASACRRTAAGSIGRTRSPRGCGAPR